MLTEKVILFQQPVDAVAKNFAKALQKQKGYCVEVTDSFFRFLRSLHKAKVVIVNTTKFDDPRFSLRLLGSIISAKLSGIPVINFFTLDTVDLCDTPVFKPLLYIINFLIARFSDRVLVLATRQHIVRRYRLSSSKVIPIHNYVDNSFWSIPQRGVGVKSHQELRLFYHGELLWWHGLERVAPIIAELQKKCPVRLIVAGNLYPTSMNLLGIKLCRQESAIKRKLHDFLRQDYVEWSGKLKRTQVKSLMQDVHFHVSQLADDSVVARTEVRTCLLEALAAGLPCLHIPTPALQQLPFEDLKNIIFIDPSSPTAAAEKIWSVFTNPEQYARISENARHLAQDKFDFARWFTSTGLPLLTALIGGKRLRVSRLTKFLDFLTRPLGVPLYFALTLISASIIKRFVKERKHIVSFNNADSEIDSHSTESIALIDELPFVSIVIPIYRSESTLAKCLDSIMRLNYPEERREIIIVDNNSPDNSRRIAEQYPVKIIDEPHQGRAFARNTGVRASAGDWIAFTDSDCMVEPNWLMKFAHSIKTHPEIAIFGGEIDSVALSSDMKQFFLEESILAQQDAMNGDMLLFPFVITANAMIRRSVFDKVGLFDTNLITAEDTEWGWRAHFSGFKMHYCPEVVVKHFHPVTPGGLFHQFYEYGVNETYLFLKHRSRIPADEMTRRLWFTPWRYRRVMKTIFLRMPLSILFSPRLLKRCILLLAKEIGYQGGRLQTNFLHPSTWKWFDLFISD
ncbi:glycosyltransferase [Candidatus Sumerlaeota bacterium]|nr:glycosyltransferase [Candidatus Sumerlaeota bacterium]